MAETKQNLPFRPLEVRGHGVWDPERKAFYPFITKNATVAAKTGVRYFIFGLLVSGANTGDHVVGQCKWQFIVGGVTCYGASAMVPVTTLASGVSSGQTSSLQMGILTDPDTEIVLQSGGCSGVSGLVVYAEIPDDISGQ